MTSKIIMIYEKRQRWKERDRTHLARPKHTNKEKARNTHTHNENGGVSSKLELDVEE